MSGIRRLAHIEVLLDRKMPLRESIKQALKINPKLFETIFIDTTHKPKKDKETLNSIIEKMEGYLQERLEKIMQPIF